MTPDDLRITRWLQASREALPPPEPGRVLPDVLARIADTPQAGRPSRPAPTRKRFSTMLTPMRLAAIASLAIVGAVSVTVTLPGRASRR